MRNETALGAYRTLQGIGLSGPNLSHADAARRTIEQWDGFERKPDGWAAYDKDGLTWRVTEAEAAAINARA
jgi:hypothetical protein